MYKTLNRIMPPPYNLVLYFVRHQCAFALSVRIYVLEMISKAKGSASESKPYLTIQCLRKKKRKRKKTKKEKRKWCLRLSRADKQQLHITHLDSERTEIALKAPTLTL